MILFEGKLLPDEEQENVLNQLWGSCIKGIQYRNDELAEKAMNACGKVAEKLKQGAYDEILKPLLAKGVFTNQQVEEVLLFFDRENLQLKYDVELGSFRKEVESDNHTKRCKCVKPLGILFHIAAGNAEGLPFFSVLEGLLAGNVNILKLPSVDDGVSILLLHEIIKEEPDLAPYICVLDVPSTNLTVMKQLADMADGIVVWGGDEAIKMIRSYATPETQIISWGHKLSFAYVTPDVLTHNDLQQELYHLAHHMCQTKQVLCSSCQGIFVDSDDTDVLESVGACYFEILQNVSKNYPPESIGVRGKLSIALYNAELEQGADNQKLFKGDGVSVTVCKDSRLELSYMFRNCWVKPLPRKQIVSCLKGYKGHLQTVGLICEKSDFEDVTDELIKAGVTRITHGGTMSHMMSGEAHDGEYPLRRYCKIVEIEK